jgi:hypothetical protein
MDFKREYAVITGDFIGFSKLPAMVRRQMYDVLKSFGRDLDAAFPGLMPYGPDMFRGDGWQILLADPVLSLRTALYVRAHIKAHAPVSGVDARLAIGVGPVDYVPEGRVSAGDGTAFRLSGKLLDGMTSPRSGLMRFGAEARGNRDLLDAIVRMTGAFAGLWTGRQALAVTGVLRGWPRSRIAGLWENSISLRAVGKHLERANWTAVESGIKAFERAMAASISSKGGICG